MNARIGFALVVAFVSLTVPPPAAAQPEPIREDSAPAVSQPASPAVPGEPRAVSAQKPDLHPPLRLYVEDAGQLPRLMGGDPRFAADAQSLAQRRTAAYVVAGLGLATSIALTIAGANDMSSPPPGDPNFGKTPGGYNLMLGGMVSLLVGSAVALAIYPHRSEVVDLVNGWNVAHPNEQLEVQPVIVTSGHLTSLDSGPSTASPSPVDTGPHLVVPATGGPPVVGIPVGGGLYVPATGGPPVPGTPVD